MIESLGLPGIVLILFSAIVCYQYIIRPLLDPLRLIPGPLLTRFTRLWELRFLHRGDLEHVTIDLHRRHGKLLNVGLAKRSDI